MKPDTPVYLDYAAATTLDSTVLKAMRPFLSDRFYNPSSLYRAAREVKKEVEAARARVAAILGAKPTEIIFTSGATESVNLAILGTSRNYPKSKILALATEHHAVLNSLDALHGEGFKTELIPVDAKGRIDLDALEKLIDDQTLLVSVAYANNETGTIQSISQIAQLIKKHRLARQKRGIDLPLYFHTDASAAAAYLPLSVERLGVDLLSLGGGKIYGPPGSGILYARRGIELKPLTYGGGQEKGRRSGTEGAALIIGLAAALELTQELRQLEGDRLMKLRDLAISRLREVEGIEINGDLKHRLPNNLNFSVDGTDGESLVLYLDEAGVQVSTGAACTTSSAEPSHVLLALGLSKEQANSNLRVTMGRGTTADDIEYFIEALAKTAKRLREIDRIER